MPEATIVKVEHKLGFLITTDESGNRREMPLKSMLRVDDIPVGLTYTQIGAISSLANLIGLLIQTLIEFGVIEDEFADDYDLPAITQAIALMGGDYSAIDLDVEVP